MKEDLPELPFKHSDLLNKRMRRIDSGEVTFKSWDLIKMKYDDKAL
ncbi:hypothetical protein [Breznakibacter xylanolyticus]